MHLVNQTPVVARLDTSDLGGSHRIGLVTAKATYRFDLAGNVALETQVPVPLFAKDEAVAGGVLPADLEPRRNPIFEVILLGHAHAPQGRAVETLRVALSVGPVRRELRVAGDRRWVPDRHGAFVATSPEPFTRMPLGFERAYGGSALARIDQHSELRLSCPLNPHGRGFDAQLLAEQLGKMLRAPEGFPVVPGYQRSLPNVESPTAPVRRWQDEPEPASWATLPHDVPLHTSRRAQQLASGNARTQLPASSTREEAAFTEIDQALYRAHPDWVIPIPARAPALRLENLLDESPDLRLQIPDQRVLVDYVLGERQGRRPLTPQMLVLLPDERRFYLLYRMPFTFQYVPRQERSVRLRLDTGWYAGGP